VFKNVVQRDIAYPIDWVPEKSLFESLLATIDLKKKLKEYEAMQRNISGAFMKKNFHKEEAWQTLTRKALLMSSKDSFSLYKKLGSQ